MRCGNNVGHFRMVDIFLFLQSPAHYLLHITNMAAESLYGIKDPSKTKTKDISSSTSLAFSTNLASLISKDSSRTSVGRPRPAKNKPDIFTQHNKNSRKRAAADIAENGEQRYKTAAEIGGVDSAALHRSKRRMEEKARIYAAMKRGDYIRPEDTRDERSLVDFDRKWAEQEREGRNNEDDATSSDSNNSDSDEELVEYQDEFGRQRKGTKAQAAREEQRQRTQAHASAEVDDQFSARPQKPSNIIHGDTVQHHAFNPDDVTSEKIALLAGKRDRSATPPEEQHYDARAEVRTKGTGFYTFSRDSEGRQEEMEALEKERVQTERERGEREARKEKKRQEIEERRRRIAQQRTKGQADRFLAGFDLGSAGVDQGG
jgi:Domain of unknown function (DUF4078)